MLAALLHAVGAAGCGDGIDHAARDRAGRWLRCSRSFCRCCAWLLVVALPARHCAERRRGPTATSRSDASAQRSPPVAGRCIGGRAHRPTLVSTGAQTSPTDARWRAIRRGCAARRRHRPPVVVGGRYDDPSRRRRVRTANEIHMPVGRPVQIMLQSQRRDPQLLGAEPRGQAGPDPGPRDRRSWLRADRPAIYRGQCAEFCGLQHAHMALVVIAEPPADFERWRERAAAPAAPAPATPQQRGGARCS